MEEKKDNAADAAVEQPVVDTEVGKQKIKRRRKIAKKDEPLTQKKVREINENVVSVWDVNAQGWRSFRVANVTGFEIKQDA